MIGAPRGHDFPVRRKGYGVNRAIMPLERVLLCQARAGAANHEQGGYYNHYPPAWDIWKPCGWQCWQPQYVLGHGFVPPLGKEGRLFPIKKWLSSVLPFIRN